MSNSPSSRPNPGKKKPAPKSQITHITCIVDSILRLNTDTIVIQGHKDGKSGKRHAITLYGSPDKAPNPDMQDILGKLANFQVRLLTIANSSDTEESEQIGNIEGYYGYVDTSGRFSM